VLIVPTVFLVSIIVFLSVRLIPGDIIDILQDELGAGMGGSLDREALEQALGLDVPIHVQYTRWVGNTLRGDLGNSLRSERAVTEEILERIPVSFELGLMGILIALAISIPIGVYSAVRQDSIGDYIARSFAIACIAIPGFWLGTLIMVFPPLWWDWSPAMEYIPLMEDPSANLLQFIIPAVLLGMALSGTTMRMTRTMMLEVLRQDYIRTAWAKGLRERIIIIRHSLKNALIPVISIVGLMLPVMIGGTVIIEEIFVLPGIGRLAVEAINQRDYTIVQGLNLLVACFVILANLLVDLTYGWLDPRIHYN